MVEELVEAHAEEVEVHDLDDGVHACHRGADTETNDRALRDRGVAHAIAEAIVQAAREAEDVASGGHIDPRDEHTLVVREFDFERGADRVHRAEHWSVGGRCRRLGTFGSRADDEIGQRGRRGSRQVPSLLDGFVELARDGGLHCFERVARSGEPPRVHEQRVACFPLANLIGRPVTLRVAFVVTVPAVGGRLDDHGTESASRRLDDLLHRGRGCDDVVAVDCDVVDAVPGGALFERRRVLCRCG